MYLDVLAYIKDNKAAKTSLKKWGGIESLLGMRMGKREIRFLIFGEKKIIVSRDVKLVFPSMNKQPK